MISLDVKRSDAIMWQLGNNKLSSRGMTARTIVMSHSTCVKMLGFAYNDGSGCDLIDAIALESC